MSAKAKEMYLVNDSTGKRYKIIRFDRERREITIEGQYNTWTEPFDKAKLQAAGYQLVME